MNWKTKKQNKKRTKEIQDKFKISKILAGVLESKKLDDNQIENFLNTSEKDLYDPFLMPDMEKAVDIILKSIKNNEKILVYGDYDVDGITSVSILKRFFDDLKVSIGVYIPNRLKEGYGINENAINLIQKQGYNLIISVDCGITSIKEVDLVHKLGMKIVITDHHEPIISKDGKTQTLPKAEAIVDCKRIDNKYKFREGCRMYGSI